MPRAVTLLAFTLVAWSIPVAAAHAAFPGRDGRIAFDSFEELEDCGDQKVCGAITNVLVTKLSGGSLTTLTACDAESDRGCGSGPAWSPDGRRIAFAGEGGIWIMNADGSDAHAVGGAAGISPAWSPDGARIVFQPYAGGIATVRTDGTDLRQLTSAATDHDPAWSRTGAIAFVRNRADDGYDVMSMTALGTRLRRILRKCVCARPDYSPDGRWIAYDNGILPKQVYVAKRDGTARRRVTRTGGEDPAWSPTGGRIAYVRDDSLYAIRIDGTGAKRIRRAPGDVRYGSPTWQPLPR